MRVLFDHQIFTNQRIGGASRYFYEIFKNAPSGLDWRLSCRYSSNIYVESFPGIREFPIRSAFRGKQRLVTMVNNLQTKADLRKNDFDIFHPTDYDDYFLGSLGKPFVVDAHDMIWELYAASLPKSELIIDRRKRLFRDAARILAVSENTKKDLLNVYPSLDADKIIVKYHGPSYDLIESESVKGDYVLFTGKRDGYKNFQRFARAIAPLLTRHKLRLVCTGSPFAKDELRLLSELRIEDRCQSKFVDEAELKRLYERALLFVFPSEYEGFGFPILEAFASRCPIALSDASCFPEIAKDAGAYFDPKDEESIRTVIESLLLSESERKALTEKGAARIKDFSWSRAVDVLMETYKGI